MVLFLNISGGEVIIPLIVTFWFGEMRLIIWDSGRTSNVLARRKYINERIRITDRFCKIPLLLKFAVAYRDFFK